MDAPNQTLEQDEVLQHHAAAHGPVSDCPLLGGGGVTLLPGGGETMDAVFAAIDAARLHVRMQYYTFEEVQWGGRSLADLLVEKCQQGVQVVLSYDGAGSQGTDDALFNRLRQAGALLLEFRPLSPLRQRFNLLTLNDRDHRKILVVDGRIAFLGGVNMARVAPDGAQPLQPISAIRNRAGDARAGRYRRCARLHHPAVAARENRRPAATSRRQCSAIRVGVDGPTASRARIGAVDHQFGSHP
jgi:hypothetical protein